MSKLVINGVCVFSTVDSSAPSVPTKGSVSVVEPSFATHRLVDGNWVPKGAPSASTPVTPKPTIGFIQPAPAVPSVPTPKGSVSFLGSRKEYLRAIEIAAGHTLLKGTNQKAIDAIRRGRLGGRKDNMSELHALLQEYSA
jgi:hypothetical protein